MIHLPYSTCALAVVAAVLLTPVPAQAHKLSLSGLSIKFDGATASSVWRLSAADLVHIARPRDADGDGAGTARDIAARGQAVQEFFGRHVRIHVNGRLCEYEPGKVKTGPGGNLALKGIFRCEYAPGLFEAHSGLHQDIQGGHRTLATLSFEGDQEAARWHTFNKGAPTWTLDLGSSPGYLLSEAGRFIWLGIEHIFTGYDHVAFLIGLLLLGGGLRRVVLIVTSFTVAHSITLALAALGKVSLSPSLVEPAIAASIAYVGIENLFVSDGRRRWMIAFFFGLVHGFGFAGVLREMGLPQGALAVSLVSFNVGVELGQVVIVALVLGAAALTDRAFAGSRYQPSRWYSPWGLRILSLAIVMVGVYWFVERTLL